MGNKPISCKDKMLKLEHSFRENMTRQQKNKDVYNFYDHIRTIGEGSISVISKIRKKDWKEPIQLDINELIDFFGLTNEHTSLECSHRSINNKKENCLASSPKHEVYCALKTVDFDHINDRYINELKNEIEILRTLDHPNIVKAYETYERKGNVAMVMELCTGGDLYSRTPYSEREVSKIIRQLLTAVSYIHQKGVIHRDLKFENILFENKTRNAQIKVIDFGLSKMYLDEEEKLMTEKVGTIYTMAPEVLNPGAYTSKADMWSIGVIAFMLLSNKLPFFGKTKAHVIQKILNCEYHFKPSNWAHVSNEAKMFVASLLNMNPEQRPDAEQALQSAWLHENFPLSDQRPKQTVINDVHQNLMKHTTIGEFKKLMLMIIAYNSTTDEIYMLRELFEDFDTSNDGYLSFSEFKEAFSTFHDSEEELHSMFCSMDIEKDGTVNYTEFLAATIEAQGEIEQERLEQAFESLDIDRTGFVSKKNLKTVLGSKCTNAFVKKLLHEVDKDGDGQISFNDFLTVFGKYPRAGVHDIDCICRV